MANTIESSSAAAAALISTEEELPEPRYWNSWGVFDLPKYFRPVREKHAIHEELYDPTWQPSASTGLQWLLTEARPTSEMIMEDGLIMPNDEGEDAIKVSAGESTRSVWPKIWKRYVQDTYCASQVEKLTAVLIQTTAGRIYRGMHALAHPESPLREGQSVFLIPDSDNAHGILDALSLDDGDSFVTVKQIRALAEHANVCSQDFFPRVADAVCVVMTKAKMRALRIARAKKVAMFTNTRDTSGYTEPLDADKSKFMSNVHDYFKEVEHYIGQSKAQGSEIGCDVPVSIASGETIKEIFHSTSHEHSNGTVALLSETSSSSSGTEISTLSLTEGPWQPPNANDAMHKIQADMRIASTRRASIQTMMETIRAEVAQKVCEKCQEDPFSAHGIVHPAGAGSTNDYVDYNAVRAAYNDLYPEFKELKDINQLARAIYLRASIITTNFSSPTLAAGKCEVISPEEASASLSVAYLAMIENVYALYTAPCITRKDLTPSHADDGPAADVAVLVERLISFPFDAWTFESKALQNDIIEYLISQIRRAGSEQVGRSEPAATAAAAFDVDSIKGEEGVGAIKEATSQEPPFDDDDDAAEKAALDEITFRCRQLQSSAASVSALLLEFRAMDPSPHELYDGGDDGDTKAMNAWSIKYMCDVSKRLRGVDTTDSVKLKCTESMYRLNMYAETVLWLSTRLALALKREFPGFEATVRPTPGVPRRFCQDPISAPDDHRQ